MPRRKKDDETPEKWFRVEFEILGKSRDEVREKVSQALEMGKITSYRTITKEKE